MKEESVFWVKTRSCFEIFQTEKSREGFAQVSRMVEMVERARRYEDMEPWGCEIPVTEREYKILQEKGFV